MNINEELQALNNQLDKLQHELAAAEKFGQATAVSDIKNRQKKIIENVDRIKAQRSEQMSKKGQEIQALKFHRPITKAEQADMGKLKKSVRGLVVVHPLTALGKEMDVEVLTGYAPKEF